MVQTNPEKKEPNDDHWWERMTIRAFSKIAFVDTDTGELQERRREHREDAEKFYRDLAAQELKATLTESVL